MRTLLSVVAIVAGLLVASAAAQDSAPVVSEAPKHPQSPLNIVFTTLGTVDLDNGTVEYVVIKPVYETRAKEITEAIVGPDGVPQTVTKLVPFTVCVCVPELRQMRIDGAVLTNPSGKKIPFVDAAKKAQLKGRDVIIAQGGAEIDPYYLKFLAKDVLILIPAAAPVPAPEAARSLAPTGVTAPPAIVPPPKMP